MKIENFVAGNGIIFYTIIKCNKPMVRDVLYISVYHKCSETLETIKYKGELNIEGNINEKFFEVFKIND